MPEARNYETKAVVIKKIKLGEADRIITFYTPDLGKIEGVAKGVRRPRSKLAGHLELLTYTDIRMARGRHLDTVIGSQAIDSFMTLKNDIRLAAQGLYTAELVNQFTSDQIANPRLFDLFVETLSRLQAANNSEITLRYFELHLLEMVGFRPQLQQCVACRVELKPVVNAFSSSAGGILCPECENTQPAAFPLSVDALKVLRLFQKSEYATAGRLKLGPELSQELKEALGNFIRYLLEREVKSATWLDNFSQQLI